MGNQGGGLRKFTRQRTDQTLTYYHSSLFQSTTLAAAQVLPQEEALNVGDKGQQDGEGAAPAPPAGGYLPYCKPDSELFYCNLSYGHRADIRADPSYIQEVRLQRLSNLRAIF